MTSQMCIPNLSANVRRGLLLLFQLQQNQPSPSCKKKINKIIIITIKLHGGAQKKRKTPVASDSELWDIYPNPHMFGTFSRRPNHFNKQKFY